MACWIDWLEKRTTGPAWRGVGGVGGASGAGVGAGAGAGAAGAGGEPGGPSLNSLRPSLRTSSTNSCACSWVSSSESLTFNLSKRE